MAKNLSKVGIITGQPVEAQHVAQSIDALTGIEAYDIDISGSLDIVGSSSFTGEVSVSENLVVTNNISASTARIADLEYPTLDGTPGQVVATNGDGTLLFTGSIAVTASRTISASYADYANQASSSFYSYFADSADTTNTASYALTTTHADTASYIDGEVMATASYVSSSNVDGPYGFDSILSASYASSSLSASYATTASHALSVLSASYAVSASYAPMAGALMGGIADGNYSGSFSGSFEGNGSGLTNLGAPGNQGNVLFNNGNVIDNAVQLIYNTASNALSIGSGINATTTLDVAGLITQRNLNNSTALGFCALNSTFTGNQNIALGNFSQISASSGTNNISIGYCSLNQNQTSDRNIAIGTTALRDNTCDSNIAIGPFAFRNVETGECNIALGQCIAIFGCCADENVFIGNQIALYAEGASRNVGLGHDSLNELVGGNDNTALGYGSGCQIGGGMQNVLVGTCAGQNIQATSCGNVIIGYKAGPIATQVHNNRLFINNNSGDALIEGTFGTPSTAQLNIRGALTASGIIYPSVDGVSGSILTTDGLGRLTFSDVNLDGIEAATSGSITTVTYNTSINEFTFTRANGTSFSLVHNTGSGGGGGSINTGSFYISSSIAGQVITFNQGDGTTETITVPSTTPTFAGSGVISSSAQIAGLGANIISSSDQILPINTSSITDFPTEVSRSAAFFGFGSGSGGGGGSADLSNLSSSIANIGAGDIITFRDSSDNSLLTDAGFTLTSASHAITASFAEVAMSAYNADNAVTASYVEGANVDGSVSSASFAETAKTASFITGSNVYGPYGANSIISASHALTASYSLNQNLSHTHTTSFSAVTSVVVQHNFNSQFNAVTVYDHNDEVIIPKRIDAVDEDQLRVYFTNPTTGVIAVTNGGILSGSSLPAMTPDPIWRTFVTGSGTNAVKPHKGINQAEGTYSNVLGGTGNCVTSTHGTIVNGCTNCNTGTFSTLGNGRDNTIDLATFSYLGGGQDNCIDQGDHNYIGGGQMNTISNNADHSTIVGGCSNTVRADQAGVLGGYNNCIRHDNSFAIGSNLTSSDEFTLYINNLNVSGNVDLSSGSAGFLSLPAIPNVSQSLKLLENSASLAIYTASVASSTITFTKGDNTTFDIVVAQSGSIDSASFATEATSASFAGDATSASYAETASYALNAYVSSSVNLNEITFNIGDGTTHTVLVNTGSGGGVASLPDYAVSGSGYVSSSVNLNVITFHQSDGTTESVTVDTGSGEALPDGLHSSSAQVVAALVGQDVNLGRVTTTELVTEIVSSSITLTSGSNIFGDEITDRHDFTGSVHISGTLSIPGFSDVSASLAAISASAAEGGGGVASIDTSSFYISSSISGDVIEFTQGDGTTETLTIPAGLRTGSSYIHTQSSANTTWTVNHNFGEQYPAVTVYDSSDQIVVPSQITATDTNTTTITFTSAQSGHATITLGGSGSADGGGLTDLGGTEVISGSQQIAELGANIVSGSGYISSSVNLNVIEFNQADGSTHTLTVDTGSSGAIDLSGTGVISSSISGSNRHLTRFDGVDLVETLIEELIAEYGGTWDYTPNHLIASASAGATGNTTFAIDTKPGSSASQYAGELNVIGNVTTNGDWNSIVNFVPVGQAQIWFVINGDPNKIVKTDSFTNTSDGNTWVADLTNPTNPTSVQTYDFQINHGDTFQVITGRVTDQGQGDHLIDGVTPGMLVSSSLFVKDNVTLYNITASSGNFFNLVVDEDGAITATASVSSGGSDIDTGSFYISSSIEGDTIEFTQGDGTTESITIPTGLRTGSSYIHTQSTATTTWNVAHNFGEQYPAVTVYNSLDRIVVPAEIEATDNDNLTITFTSAQSGHATITLGGENFTGSNNLSITNAADDRIVTSRGGNGLNAEANLTFDGTAFGIPGFPDVSASLAAISASAADGGGGSYTLTNTNIAGLGVGIVSSSAQTIANLPAGVISGSSQVDFGVANGVIPSGDGAGGFNNSGIATATNVIYIGKDRLAFGASQDGEGAIDAGPRAFLDPNRLTLAAVTNESATNGIRITDSSTAGASTITISSEDGVQITGSLDINSTLGIPGFPNVSASLAAISSSAAEGGGGVASIDTGSFYISSSIEGNAIEFTQGDGTTETLTIPAGLRTGSSYIHTQSAASTTWTVNHNFNERYPAITVYNSSNEVIIPSIISSTNVNTTTITFTSAQSGHATITLGGSGSAGGGGYTLTNADIADLGVGIVSSSAQVVSHLPEGVISGSILTSSITDFNTHVSSAAAAAGFGAGGGLTDLSGTGVISSSLQIAELGANILSSSAQIASDISGAFDEVSASLATDIATALAIDTGSFFTGSSLDGNTITFEKADGTNESLNISYLATGSSYMFEQATSATTWSINHNFGEQYPAVTVYDGSDEIIVPMSIRSVDGNNTEVTFTSPQSGHATITLGGSGSAYTLENSAIAGLGAGIVSSSAQIENLTTYSASFSAVSNYTASHNLGQRLVMVQTYDENYNQFIPDNIRLHDSNEVHISFGVVKSGYVVVKK